MVREFQIKVVVCNEDNKYTEDDIDEMFVQWANENGLLARGSILELEKEEK